MILGHEVDLDDVRIERVQSRPAGPGQVHISFKLGFQAQDYRVDYGALLVPLPEAITMACLILMMPDETVMARRKEPTLDSTLKDAMLEIGNMIGGATNTAVAESGYLSWTARSVGCQGVRAGVRPAFPYEEGHELVVARARAKVGHFPEFELLLILPVLV